MKIDKKEMDEMVSIFGFVYYGYFDNLEWSK